MTRVTRIMTPGTLIFASATTTGRPSVVQYIRPEAIGVVPGSLAAAQEFKENRARGFTTLVRFFLGDVRSNPCYTSLEKILT